MIICAYASLITLCNGAVEQSSLKPHVQSHTYSIMFLFFFLICLIKSLMSLIASMNVNEYVLNHYWSLSTDLSVTAEIFWVLCLPRVSEGGHWENSTEEGLLGGHGHWQRKVFVVSPPLLSFLQISLPLHSVKCFFIAFSFKRRYSLRELMNKLVC